MRRGALLWLPLLAVYLLGVPRALARCDREPDGHSSRKLPADNRFRIKISGNPNKYVPGVVYTVSLQGTRTHQVAQKFTGFVLVVEPSVPVTIDEARSGVMMPGSPPGPGAMLDGATHPSITTDSSNSQQRSQVGRFNLFGDTLIKFSERCPNTVIQTSTLPKSEVQVMWTAPPSGSGCVVFRATVVEYRDQWYMDDGPLSKQLCEDVQESLDEQPKVNDPCCACDEAKYEVTFEGLWSRHTHPKDFPTNGWLTRFSDVIGASHTAEYRFWDYGRFASEGLRQVSERGATRMLESELKADSQHIRTIIKARGISYPNVTGKTFAVFRVDRRHHLMSLVSMIDPSPDWIVGVSGLELCLRNCSWVEHKVLNLYPWDAGTDSGPSYISPDMPTTPRETIRRITSSFPNDPESPFYDPSGNEMKPLARLYLTRQRLYEKSCAEDPADLEDPRDLDSSQSTDCEVHDWSEWSPCLVTCGKGIKHRQRFYVNPLKAEIQLCNRLLTSRTTCYVARACGPVDPRLEDPVNVNPRCQLTEWTQWSGCSVSCGQGQHTRTRGYKIRQGRKYCSSLPNAQRLQQTDVCNVGGPQCPEGDLEDSSDPANCPMTQWSQWSPCSVTCGKGMSMRNRIRGVMDNQQLAMMTNFDDNYDGATIGSDEECSEVRTVEEVACEADVSSCEMQPEQAKDVCTMEKEVGPCRLSILRWFFDTQTESCQQFSFTGCRGNKNNFLSKEDCEQACSSYIVDQVPTDPFHGFKSSSQIRDPNSSRQYGLSSLPTITDDPTAAGDSHHPDPDNNYLTTVHGPPVDCEMTRWSQWTPCNVSCGRGYKERSRRIKVQPRNGGRPCAKKLMRKKKCKTTPCEFLEQSDENPTWGEAHKPDIHRVSNDCELSLWSPWSPCSMSCGLDAVQQRTRSILSPHSSGGLPCGHRLETRSCALLPCIF